MPEPITRCRACLSKDLIKFLDLGEQYISDFREDESKPPKYPLEAVFCCDCKLVQLNHTTPQVEMYHENYGFKSGINEKILEDLEDIATHAYQYKPNPDSWLDIASNDGSLLSFVPKDVYRVGVDPVGFLCKEAEQHADKIINDYYSTDVIREQFDVITSISCFYDMPDPNIFVEDVRDNLAPRGVWIIQQNYLLTTLQLGAVDNFCAEHLEYYTLLSLENLLRKFGLEVNEVTISMVNGGSIRTVVSRKGTFPVDESVQKQRDIEHEAGLQNIGPYLDFATSAYEQLDKLKSMLEDIKKEGKSIAILAASTRGATIWQSAGIDADLVDYAIERNPAKVGRWFSAIGIPIISEGAFKENPSDYAIIGPWFFADQIVDRMEYYLKQGGKLITPLPEVKVINEKD